MCFAFTLPVVFFNGIYFENLNINQLIFIKYLAFIWLITGGHKKRYVTMISSFVPDIVFLSRSKLSRWLTQFLKIVFSSVGLNLLDENRNCKTTMKTVFIVTFKLIFCR